MGGTSLTPASFGGNVIEETAQLADEGSVEAAEFNPFGAVVFEMQDADVLDPDGFIIQDKGVEPVKPGSQTINAFVFEGEATLEEGVTAGAEFILEALVFEGIERGGAGGPIIAVGPFAKGAMRIGGGGSKGLIVLEQGLEAAPRAEAKEVEQGGMGNGGFRASVVEVRQGARAGGVPDEFWGARRGHGWLQAGWEERSTSEILYKLLASGTY
jgi:hypothetical protein